MKSGPHLPQQEKALAQKRRPNAAINKKQTNKQTKNRLRYDSLELFLELSDQEFKITPINMLKAQMEKGRQQARTDG